jgi:hypothetical protein
MDEKSRRLREMLQEFFVAAGDFRWAEVEKLQLEVDFDPERQMKEAAEKMSLLERQINDLYGQKVDVTFGEEIMAEEEE